MTAPLDLNDVRLFMKVVQRGSLSAAAQEQNLPKSKLSRRIAHLEQQLGLQLLNRENRPLTPTQEGREIYGHYAELIEQMDQAEEQVRALYSEPSGTLRVSLPADLTLAQIGRAVPEFCKAHPDVEVICDLSLRYDRFASPEGKEPDFDVAVTISEGDLPGRELISRRIFQGPRRLFAAPSLLQSLPPITSIAQLRDLPCLLPTFKNSWRFANEQVIPVSGPLRINSTVGLAQAAVIGLGIVSLPPIVCQKLTQPNELVEITLDVQPADYSVYLFYKDRVLLPARTRAFITFLESRLPFPPDGHAISH